MMVLIMVQMFFVSDEDVGTLINDDGRERISGMENFLCIS